MKTRNYLVVSTAIFGVAAVVQLTRFVMGLPAQIGTWSVPLGASLFAMLLAGSLAMWGAALLRRG